MTVGPPTPDGSSVGLLEQPFGGPDPAGPGNGAPAPSPDVAGRGRLARFVLGRQSDPVWVRPALLTLLTLTAVLYLWDLGASGWGNSFYSAAVQAGTKSWKAFFFGSSDSSNFITVDKPPASLWMMEISARIFGLNSWSILVPQALEGVATVGVVYLTVRRWFTAQAALLAGAVVALTPVAAMMFRFNNPDSLLALLLAGSMYALVRALEKAQTRWLVLAGTLVGFGFITKMLQAFLIIPALVIVYLLAAPTGWWRRVWQVGVMGVATLVAAGWWVAAVALTPAADRPYIGGSQNNSVLNLIFGYNGFGRLTGSESGSVVGGGGAGSAGQWGPTGVLRLFNASFGNMMSWLLPGALLMGAVLLVLTIRARRTDRERAALLLFGGALVGTGLVISLGQGIIHPYYTVALAAPLGGLVGIGTMGLWQRRSTWAGRIGLAAGLLATSIWGFVLLDRTPEWFPFLRFVVLVGGYSAPPPSWPCRCCAPFPNWRWAWWRSWAWAPPWWRPCSPPSPQPRCPTRAPSRRSRRHRRAPASAEAASAAGAVPGASRDSVEPARAPAPGAGLPAASPVAPLRRVAFQGPERAEEPRGAGSRAAGSPAGSAAASAVVPRGRAPPAVSAAASSTPAARVPP